MKKLLYAMRHCETLFNVQHKSQGWCDSPITPRGVEQCRLAGEELVRRGMTFDHFYSSTSERCCDTMELVCQSAFGEVKPYVRKKGLRECGFGIFEAKDDFCEPNFFPVQGLDIRSLVMQAGGGEADEQIDTRINDCLSQIMENQNTKNVLVVSSGGVLRHFFMAHNDTSRVKGMPSNGNCMTYVYEWEDGVFSCIEVFTADFTGIECGGLDGSGVPNRWAIDEDLLAQAIAKSAADA
ncbi:MAG: histidine phosphatase family protein [Atopobiaceae bacterium]|nr:histidine phosphatase family protein [Atopobiaceae bacterium]